MVFESIRSAQALATSKTDQLYPRIELSNPDCYQIVGEHSDQESLPFTDKFVIDNKNLQSKIPKTGSHTVFHVVL